MSGSVNKVILVDEYLAGFSIPELSARHNLSKSSVRLIVLAAGVMRSRADAVRNAAKRGRLGSGLRGKNRTFTDLHKNRISQTKLLLGEKTAVGRSLKPSGYFEITRGVNKGKSEHRALMENFIGRKLSSDEVVHHKDGNKRNNELSNLEIMTNSEHVRLHRIEEQYAGKLRERNSNGRFS